MSLMRLPLMILLPVLLATTLAGCGSYTERTVYVPTTASTPVVVPSNGYYYRDAYYPTYVAYPYRTYYTSY